MRTKLILGIFLVAAITARAADTPSPALIVLNKHDANLAVVDPASGNVVGRVATGVEPHEVAVSTDGTLAFVANWGTAREAGRTLSVIDLVALKELHRVDLGPLRRPHGIAFAGGKAYFTAETNKLIGRYDPATNQVDWLLGTGQETTHMVIVSRNLTTIFTSNIDSDSISIFERTSFDRKNETWKHTVVPVGGGPEGFDVSPDGYELWAAHTRGGGVSVVNLQTKQVTETIKLEAKRLSRLKFTPDGAHVLITDFDAGELMILDVQTHKEIKRLKMGRFPEGIQIVPDGSRAYIAVAGDNTIVVLDLKTWDVTGHITPGAEPDGMAWAVRR